LTRFSNKVNSKKGKLASEYIFVIVETMLAVGPNIVGKTKDQFIYMAKDKGGNY